MNQVRELISQRYTLEKEQDRLRREYRRLIQERQDVVELHKLLVQECRALLALLSRTH